MKNTGECRTAANVFRKKWVELLRFNYKVQEFLLKSSTSNANRFNWLLLFSIKSIESELYMQMRSLNSSIPEEGAGWQRGSIEYCIFARSRAICKKSSCGIGAVLNIIRFTALFVRNRLYFFCSSTFPAKFNSECFGEGENQSYRID